MKGNEEFERTPLGALRTSAGTWAGRLRRGDAQAVQEVRQRVVRALRHSRWSIPTEDRDDLEQEVMTDVWQAVNRSNFDFSAGFWGFVEVVIARRCIDWLRTRRKHDPLPDEALSSEHGPLRVTLNREQRTLASNVLSSLGSSCRDLIVFRLRDGLSYREISRRTGKSEGALRVQFYRCVQRARHAGRRLEGNFFERIEEESR